MFSIERIKSVLVKNGGSFKASTGDEVTLSPQERVRILHLTLHDGSPLYAVQKRGGATVYFNSNTFETFKKLEEQL